MTADHSGIFAPVAIALLCPLDAISAIAWAAVVLAGALVARGRPLRSLALAWIAHAVTGAPLAAAASASASTRARVAPVVVAALAPFLSIVWPPSLRNAGAVLLVVMVATVIRRRFAERAGRVELESSSPLEAQSPGAKVAPRNDRARFPRAQRGDDRVTGARAAAGDAS